jgi:hypothetical protein
VCGSVVASYVVEGFSIEGVRDRDAADIRRRFDAFREIVSYDKQ